MKEASPGDIGELESSQQECLRLWFTQAAQFVCAESVVGTALCPFRAAEPKIEAQQEPIGTGRVETVRIQTHSPQLKCHVHLQSVWFTTVGHRLPALKLGEHRFDGWGQLLVGIMDIPRSRC
jgi:hypothetical protein